MTWGKCTVCTNIRDNMTEHHSKELEDDKIIVCRDCHMTLEQYAAAVDSIRIVKKSSNHQVVAGKPVATPRSFGAAV